MKSLALGALVVTCVFQPASAQNLPPRRPAHAVRTTAMRIAPLSGSSPRTFVSSAGMDTNPCSRSAPCRSFGAAIAQTAAGGEVIVLDSAGYGPATIGSSISLIAPRGVYAGVSVPGGAGITISAAATDVVTLRGLTLNGTGGGDGIYLASGGVLYLQQLTIQNFSDYGILALPTTSAVLRIEDTTVTRSGITGAFLGSQTMGVIVQCTIVDSRFEDGSNGVDAWFGAYVAVQRCVATGNSGIGFYAEAGDLSVDDSFTSHNDFGLFSSSTERVARTFIVNNNTGVSYLLGTIDSWGDNHLAGNGTDGSFSGTLSLH